MQELQTLELSQSTPGLGPRLTTIISSAALSTRKDTSHGRYGDGYHHGGRPCCCAGRAAILTQRYALLCITNLSCGEGEEFALLIVGWRTLASFVNNSISLELAYMILKACF